MLNIKKLLTKLCGRVNYRIISSTSSPFSLAASGTKWVSCPLPSSGTVIAVIGYYIGGATQVSLYNISLAQNGASFAIRNYGTTELTNITIQAHYLVVD